MAIPALSIRNIEKRYAMNRRLREMVCFSFKPGRVVNALSQVSFAVNQGEILGIVGPNGAGKTTLLRILADLLEPDEGKVCLWGHNFKDEGYRIRRRIGYASSDERNFFWRISGRHNIEFFAQLYGLHTDEARSRMLVLLDQLELGKKADDPFYTYSSGTKKRVSLIRALIHEPQLVLLDELTNSLDPGSAKCAKQLVRTYLSSGPGRVALWSSHRLEEINEVCDKVLVLNEGKVAFFGNVDDHDFTGYQ